MYNSTYFHKTNTAETHDSLGETGVLDDQFTSYVNVLLQLKYQKHDTLCLIQSAATNIVSSDPAGYSGECIWALMSARLLS